MPQSSWTRFSGAALIVFSAVSHLASRVAINTQSIHIGVPIASSSPKGAQWATKAPNIEFRDGKTAPSATDPSAFTTSYTAGKTTVAMIDPENETEPPFGAGMHTQSGTGSVPDQSSNTVTDVGGGFDTSTENDSQPPAETSTKYRQDATATTATGSSERNIITQTDGSQTATTTTGQSHTVGQSSTGKRHSPKSTQSSTTTPMSHPGTDSQPNPQTSRLVQHPGNNGTTNTAPTAKPSPVISGTDSEAVPGTTSPPPPPPRFSTGGVVDSLNSAASLGQSLLPMPTKPGQQKRALVFGPRNGVLYVLRNWSNHTKPSFLGEGSSSLKGNTRNGLNNLDDKIGGFISNLGGGGRGGGGSGCGSKRKRGLLDGVTDTFSTAIDAFSCIDDMVGKITDHVKADDTGPVSNLIDDLVGRNNALTGSDNEDPDPGEDEDEDEDDDLETNTVSTTASTQTTDTESTTTTETTSESTSTCTDITALQVTFCRKPTYHTTDRSISTSTTCTPSTTRTVTGCSATPTTTTVTKGRYMSTTHPDHCFSYYHYVHGDCSSAGHSRLQVHLLSTAALYSH
ncbi:hypothetical protein BDW62DRAFT_204483 [Aspergillus aurantiobrunneus]